MPNIGQGTGLAFEDGYELVGLIHKKLGIKLKLMGIKHVSIYELVDLKHTKLGRGRMNRFKTRENSAGAEVLAVLTPKPDTQETGSKEI